MRTQFLYLCFYFVILSGYSQPFNTEIASASGSPTLIGKINKQGLCGNEYGKWFLKNYGDYSPDQTIISKLKEQLHNYTITVFMGTWCGDSKREVPRFYKILDEADFPMQRLTTVAVAGERAVYKQSPGGEQEGKNIHRVPTFIFYKDGIEVNRITEHPVRSLEEDMLNILQKRYTPNYYGVTLVYDSLKENGLSQFRKKMKKLVPELKRYIKNRYELNTYATVLFCTGKTEESIAVFELNTFLFSDEVGSYLSLANTLGVNGNLNKAIVNYEKVLSIDPDNEEAKSGISHLKSKISN